MNEALLRQIPSVALEHLYLVAVSVFIAVCLAVPAGILLAHNVRPRRAVLGAVNILQTIPSLALFGFLLPVPLIGGIGKQTAIVALVVYALLPILRNTVTGLLAVNPAVLDAAIAMGMDRRQRLREVEIPLAASSILGGIRIATVTTIGTATIAAAIGGGGLGTFIFRGIAMVDSTTILAGAIPAALLAVVADEGLEWCERRLSR